MAIAGVVVTTALINSRALIAARTNSNRHHATTSLIAADVSKSAPIWVSHLLRPRRIPAKIGNAVPHIDTPMKKQMATAPHPPAQNRPPARGEGQVLAEKEL